MEKDDEAARKARAESLLQEIDQLTSPTATEEKSAASDTEEEKNAKTTESAREFIHRRMNELDHEKDS